MSASDSTTGRRLAIGLGSGALFGVGLVVSGMTRPSKVVGFLDIAGAWDASLAFVMVGAIATHAVTLRLIRRLRQAPLFAERFHEPAAGKIDARLIAGAALFGVGWGLSGYCPGPAVVAVGSFAPGAVVFTTAMLVGIAAHTALFGAKPDARSASVAEAPRPLKTVPASDDG